MWRSNLYEISLSIIENSNSISEAVVLLNQNIFEEFGVIYSTARPKADQSPSESINAGMASCTGLSILLIDACRSVGIPARFVGTPSWINNSEIIHGLRYGITVGILLVLQNQSMISSMMVGF